MHESGEMYLKTILILNQRLGNVRAIDIATELNYSKASVSRALNILLRDGYIFRDEKGFITLSPKGIETSTNIYDKHTNLTDFLVNVLDVSYEVAAKDACKIEHVISDETFDKIKEYLNKKGS